MRPEWWPEGAIGIHGRDYENHTPVFQRDTTTEVFHMDADCHHLAEAFVHVETLPKVMTSYKGRPCKACSPTVAECVRLAIKEGVHPVTMHPRPEDLGLTATGHEVHFKEVIA